MQLVKLRVRAAALSSKRSVMQVRGLRPSQVKMTLCSTLVLLMSERLLRVGQLRDL